MKICKDIKMKRNLQNVHDAGSFLIFKTANVM